jgi:hypothetical protein
VAAPPPLTHLPLPLLYLILPLRLLFPSIPIHVYPIYMLSTPANPPQEARLALVRMAERFEFELPPGAPRGELPLQQGITMTAKGGVALTVKRREGIAGA